jgi:arabinogalactan oligomer/maltooligosaccharide transport system permease protein
MTGPDGFPVDTRIVAPVEPASRRKGLSWWARTTGWRHPVGLAAAAFAILPLLYVLSASLSTARTLTSSGGLFQSITLENYQDLLSSQTIPYVDWWLNTMKIATMTSIGAVAVSALAGYAFSRLRFRGRRQGLIGLLILQLFPSVLGLVALFTLLYWLGGIFPILGIGSQLSLILVYVGGGLGVTTYIIAGNFNTVPREIDEAARIDGAGHLRIFLTIILPLSVPMLVVVTVITFLATIGDFAIASIVLTKPETLTVAVGLTGLVSASGEMRNSNWGLFTAGAVMVAVPVLVLFFALQRWIVSGLTSGSVK